MEAATALRVGLLPVVRELESHLTLEISELEWDCESEKGARKNLLGFPTNKKRTAGAVPLYRDNYHVVTDPKGHAVLALVLWSQMTLQPPKSTGRWAHRLL